ncbi:hypothetical protein ACFW2E_27310, partial [Streptomyces sp. NPDC058964]
MSMLGIDIGHRYGRVGRLGPDGRPAVATTALGGTDGVAAPAAALALLLAAVPDGPADREAVLGLPAQGGREDELRRAAEDAGLVVDRIVPEPVAVALHYGASDQGVRRTVSSGTPRA